MEQATSSVSVSAVPGRVVTSGLYYSLTGSRHEMRLPAAAEELVAREASARAIVLPKWLEQDKLAQDYLLLLPDQSRMNAVYLFTSFTGAMSFDCERVKFVHHLIYALFQAGIEPSNEETYRYHNLPIDVFDIVSAALVHVRADALACLNAASDDDTAAAAEALLEADAIYRVHERELEQRKLEKLEALAAERAWVVKLKRQYALDRLEQLVAIGAPEYGVAPLPAPQAGGFSRRLRERWFLPRVRAQRLKAERKVSLVGPVDNQSGEKIPIKHAEKVREPKPVRWVAEQHRQAALVYVTDRDKASKEARAVRENVQRACAKSKARAEYKAQPKEERARAVLSLRDKRSPVAEFQSGESKAVYWAAAGVGIGSVATLAALSPLYVPAVQRRLTAACDYAARLSRKVETVVDDTSDIMAWLKNLKNAILGVCDVRTWLTPFVMTVWFAVSKLKPLTILKKFVIKALESLVGPVVWARISAYFRIGDVELQSGEIGYMAKLLSATVCASIFKDGFTVRQLNEFAKRIAAFDRSCNGWEGFIKWVASGVEAIARYIDSNFNTQFGKYFDKNKTILDLWLSDVSQIECDFKASTKPVTPALIDKMVSLTVQGAAHIEAMRDMPIVRSLKEAQYVLYQCLAPCMGAMQARNNFRVEPIGVCISGPPGVGKTLLATFFTTAIMMESGLYDFKNFDEYAAQIFQKGNSEYWNGYVGQAVLIMDDAFQAVATPSIIDNDYMTTIRAISTWAFPLNYADLPSKGKFYFSSQLVYATTNVASIVSGANEVIYEPEAVSRRFPHSFQLCVRDEYLRSGKLDYVKFEEECEKMQNEVGIDRVPWHIWYLRRHNLITGAIDYNTTFELKEVILDLARELYRRNKSHDNLKQKLDKMVVSKAMVAQQKDVQFQSGFKACWSFVKDAPRLLQASLGYTTAPADSFLAVRAAQIKADWDETLRDCRSAPSAKAWAKFALYSFCGGAVAVTVFKLAYNMLAALWGFFFPGVSVEFASADKVVVQSNRKETLSVRRRTRKRSVVLQSGSANQRRRAYASTYKMVLNTRDGCVQCLGQVLFVRDRVAVMPDHFLSVGLAEAVRDGDADDDSVINFINSIQPEHSFDLTLKQFLSFRRLNKPSEDFAAVEFVGVRAHADLVSYFLKESDVRTINNVSAVLDIAKLNEGSVMLKVPKQWSQVLTRVNQGKNLRIRDRSMARFYQYTSDTASGDCGAPLTLLDNTLYSGRMIMGFHCAGSVVRLEGYANVVTQEMVSSACEHFGAIVDDFDVDLASRGVKFQAGEVMPFQTMGSFLPLGQLEVPLNMTTRTAYFVTEFYGVFGDYDCWPAKLGPVHVDGELVYPMERAVAPYSTKLLVYDEPRLPHAVHVAMSKFTELTRGHTSRIFTKQEAVLGVVQEKFRSIPRGTSPGFPYNQDSHVGKKAFFGDAPEYDLTRPECVALFERVDHVLDQARKGVRCAHLFTDFLKDELRGREKVEAVATRLISSAPLDYTIAWRVMFGDFSAQFFRFNTVSGFAPGVCCYSDWGVLAGILQQKGDKVFDGDFKSFDAMEQPVVHEAVLEYVNRWYNDSTENQLARKVLWLDLVHSRHVGGKGTDQRYMYQWNKSLPSGHPFTTIINSIYSMVMLVLAHGYTTGRWTSFYDEVSAVTYGDDNIVNVQDDVADEFNISSVAQVLKDKYKLTYTCGRKDGSVLDYATLTECTFLKRGFHLTPSGWTAPLELDSFLYTVYWCKNKKLKDKICRDMLETTLYELSLHPKRVWDEWAQVVYRVLEETGAVPHTVCDQNAYLALVQARTDAWY